jgi:Na+/melibiose symporter-like transporter
MTATPLVSLAAAAATDIVAFAAIEIVLYAFITATVSSSVVMLAEGLPIEMRAKGQSYGGLALGLGGGLCVILMPLLAAYEYSWRWSLVLAGFGLLGVPAIAHSLPESERWRRVAASGAATRTRFYDIFGSRHRRRALPILVCYLLSTTASTAITSWGYFHAVKVVGLSAAAASAMMIAGGAFSLAGLTGGAWGAERFGRVPTVAVAGLLTASGAIFFYWGPPADFAQPAVWLGCGFCWFMTAVNAWMVGGNAAATELFPTALRGTLVGWFAIAQAVAAVGSQAAIAALAGPLGGLSVVVGYLALLALPSALIFRLFIDETRGLSLEAAAREERF